MSRNLPMKLPWGNNHQLWLRVPGFWATVEVMWTAGWFCYLLGSYEVHGARHRIAWTWSQKDVRSEIWCKRFLRWCFWTSLSRASQPAKGSLGEALKVANGHWIILDNPHGTDEGFLTNLQMGSNGFVQQQHTHKSMVQKACHLDALLTKRIL